MTTLRTMQTVQDLKKLLDLLDPSSFIMCSIWVRSPGKGTPRKLGVAGQLGTKLVGDVAAKVRSLVVAGQSFSAAAVAVGVHRATVSRYLQAEMKAGRIQKLQDGGYAMTKGAYLLEPKPVNGSPSPTQT